MKNAINNLIIILLVVLLLLSAVQAIQINKISDGGIVNPISSTSSGNNNNVQVASRTPQAPTMVGGC
ncbi:MAG TPA: hypothetical protein VJI69_01200 [Bacteroidia bacterium]|nr:hypothetical protein [Bacteroidia bacterium]